MKHTDWQCPNCKKKLTTLPTASAPTHRCTPLTKKATTLIPRK